MEKIVLNHRLPNGDVGHKKCDLCNRKSGAYYNHEFYKCMETCSMLICKACLCDMIKSIDKAIIKNCIEKGKEKDGII